MWAQFIEDWENARLELENENTSNNIKTITITLTEEEIDFVKKSLMFLADTTGSDERAEFAWNIIDKINY